MAEPYIPENKVSAKTGFLNVAFDILDGDISIERDLEYQGTSLEDLERIFPRPNKPAPSNGVAAVSCSTCGIGCVPLRLNMQKGWLCARCHREHDVAMGYTDEYGWR